MMQRNNIFDEREEVFNTHRNSSIRIGINGIRKEDKKVKSE